MKRLRVVPAGINVIDGRRIAREELEEEICVIDGEEVAVNVNTPDDLEIAQRLFADSAGGISHHGQG